MKKRFIDCDIWDDPWYRKLPCEYKELWRFMVDKCDAIGVWKVDFDTAAYFIKGDVKYDKALELFNAGKDRIEVLDVENWAVVNFVPFQYGRLSYSCPAHKPVFFLLSKYPIKYPNARVFNTLQEEDMDKDKEQERCHEDNYKNIYCFKCGHTGKILKSHTGKITCGKCGAEVKAI